VNDSIVLEDIWRTCLENKRTLSLRRRDSVQLYVNVSYLFYTVFEVNSLWLSSMASMRESSQFDSSQSDSATTSKSKYHHSRTTSVGTLQISDICGYSLVADSNLQLLQMSSTCTCISRVVYLGYIRVRVDTALHVHVTIFF
jgi:hypothetical protein